MDGSGLSAGVSPTERARAIGYLAAFFTGRETWKGEAMTPGTLSADLNIYITLRMGVGLGLQVYHEMLDAHRAKGLTLAEVDISDTIKRGRLYMQLASECRARNIPQHYSGGIVVIWLWLCRGVDLPGGGEEISGRMDEAA